MANKGLNFENENYKKLTQALEKADSSLALQNQEMEKRAVELAAANKELAYQIEQKEKRAAELEASNKELEAFTYSVSHDLRAPLRAINGFSQVLLEDYGDKLEEDAINVLSEIINNAKKMGNLIDNLLEFSRLGKRQLSLNLLDIEKLIHEVIDELKQLEPNRNINITINKIEDVPGDRNLLKQVFVNLISNAFKYTSKKERSEISIGSYIENENCIYYIKDNGAGFDMRYYDMLFGVFQRLHSSNEFDGTGVGLAITHKIVTKHGGKVWAEGKVGEGACFYIALPKIQKN